MLPADSATVDGNKLTLAIASAEIIVTAQPNGNFSVQSFVGGVSLRAKPARELRVRIGHF
jgi:hypothetical protein